MLSLTAFTTRTSFLTRFLSTSTSTSSKKSSILHPCIRSVLIRRPPPNFALGLTTPSFGKPINTDYGIALRQWLRYVNVFENRGIKTISLPPLDENCPDAVFVEDTSIFFKSQHESNSESVAVICENMAEERRPEVESMKEVVLGLEDESLGGKFDRVEYVNGEGEKLDGGDVLKCPVSNKVYVGLSSRSNALGVKKLQYLLPDHEVVGVPITKVLHLKSCVTALPDGRIIGYDPLVDDKEIFGSEYFSVPEEGGAHVVILDEKTLLIAASAPKTAELLSKEGYDLEIVDIDQFEKLEGCVTCLSVRRR